MRSFTSYLQKSVRPEWSNHYLDYLSLKTLLERFGERRNELTDEVTIEGIERFYPEAEGANEIEFKKSKSEFSDFNLMTPSDEFEQANSKCSVFVIFKKMYLSTYLTLDPMCLVYEYIIFVCQQKVKQSKITLQD